MANSKNTGTKDYPLIFAKTLKQRVNECFDSGAMHNQVSETTRDLLRFWFSDTFCEQRSINFHAGQRQAILNTIYVHEVLKTKNVFDMYEAVDGDILAEMGVNEINSSKYNHPKYCMKMATGTGKTWVMHALLIWQYLNAQYEKTEAAHYSKNFLIVAPGLIVYERLLDAYLGKEQEDGMRRFTTSDFFKFQTLFIPENYKETLFAFIQNSVVSKDEIGQRCAGDGIIAITNWHLLIGNEEEAFLETEVDPFVCSQRAIKELLPIAPGKTAGHSLDALDRRYFAGTELEFLANLKNIVVINDEAHHIHEVKSAGIVEEVEWQNSLNYIAENKGDSFIQIDFSATPYNVTGSGQKRTKHYFPHIVVDFDLKTAIHGGLVKTIVLDKRKSIVSQELSRLDFKAERDNRNKAVALSEGQKIMLRAGMSKLNILESQFKAFTQNNAQMKYPKLLIVCEDTSVSPLVVDYLKAYEGLSSDDVIQIDSDTKGSIPQAEWQDIKRKLFNIDNLKAPKVIVSVLMLREGFDVNNICVIVPLRSSEAPILLEQIVGRGLRLMWRGENYEEVKAENRENLLVKKREPVNYFDILSIVEHPAFVQFYEDLLKDGLIAEASDMQNTRDSILGDMIDVELKPDYKDFDLFFPRIVKDKEEILCEQIIDISKLEPFKAFPFSRLKQFVKDRGESFISEEITVKTTFGNYKVNESVFNANSYNEFIMRIVQALSASMEKTGTRRIESFPFMQINIAQTANSIDRFIRERLFERDFDPFDDENWRVLLLRKSTIVEHIITQIGKTLYDMQNNIKVSDAIVEELWFSSVDSIKIRENYCVHVSKSIYSALPYPSNKGLYERDFMVFFDCDAEVERLIKIKENEYPFSYILYLRNDGIFSRYYPDFMLKLKDDIYLVETKAEKDLDNVNVLKKQCATLDWIKKINLLNPSQRMNSQWHYAVVSDNLFYQYKQNAASARDILERSVIKKTTIHNDSFVFE